MGARFLLKGGFRYTPQDAAASLAAGKYVADDSRFYELQVPNYNRIDARISYTYNKPKMSGKINLDIQNVLNNNNTRSVGYSAETNTLFFDNRGSGFVPVLSFQWDF